ncbi:MAG: HutD family protein [Phenylobacterium sp.]|uniref:HutD/Ves family protein n=1 Tax=Phenylobacterium sp. TaxID=1871053 RepID=UPI0027370162|nr:HutD family protein [Phenylobacterium sp.]MDP3748547.1 HutD family protein [Phenylobacterium sp.]
MTRVLRAGDQIAVPWKNGGGITRELAVQPAGAPMDAFDWRISIAEVAEGGPFSSFPGIDRVLTVIEGAGLSLSIDGRTAVTMDATSPPLAFPGEARCEASLKFGPIRDLNIMVRRGVSRAHVRRRSLDAGDALTCTSEATLLLALEAVAASWPGGEAALAREDALLAPAGTQVGFATAVRLIVAEIDL